MEKQFVTYEIALKLKEKGFDEECLGTHQILSAKPSYMYGKITHYDIETNKVPELCIQHSKTQKNSYLENEIFNGVKWGAIATPLWQQVIDWFENNHIWINITPPYGKDILFEYTIYAIKSNGVLKGKLGEGFDFKTKFEAREAAINHALTLI
jgi:hypothetical protein